MALLNRILSILMVLLALTAAAFSYLLFERREEFKGRADKLAKTVSEMVVAMDTESNTNNKSRINFTPGTPETPETGTLGWKAYHDAKDPEKTYAQFSNTLKIATQQAQGLAKQKNYLADTVAQAGKDLGLPEDMVNAADLKDLSDEDLYQGAGKDLLGHVEALMVRDRQMISAIVSAAEIVKVDVNESTFNERTRVQDLEEEEAKETLGPYECGPVLTDVKFGISRLNDRANDYAKTLSEAISKINRFDWETDRGQIPDPETYGTAMTSMMNDFEGVNSKLALLDKTVEELNAMRSKLEKAEDDVMVLRTEVRKTEGDRDRWKTEYERISATITSSGPGGETTHTVREIPNDLEGKIVQVNDEWNFVILDFGGDKIPPGPHEFLIARNDEFVARVRVSKVLSKISIAEVLPEVRNGVIHVGDRVITPKQ